MTGNSEGEPRDPFREERSAGPWDYSLRQGEMLVQGLAEVPDSARAITRPLRRTNVVRLSPRRRRWP